MRCIESNMYRKLGSMQKTGVETSFHWSQYKFSRRMYRRKGRGPKHQEEVLRLRALTSSQVVYTSKRNWEDFRNLWVPVYLWIAKSALIYGRNIFLVIFAILLSTNKSIVSRHSMLWPFSCSEKGVSTDLQHRTWVLYLQGTNLKSSCGSWKPRLTDRFELNVIWRNCG